MKATILLTILLSGWYATSFADHAKPNIIFVLADDLGWAELGCYGNRFNETLNLDKMASDWIRFSHAYATAPVCLPYRVSFPTGEQTARIGITDYLLPDFANELFPAHQAECG